MANQITSAGADGVALMVTKEARSAGMVEENSEGEPRYMADVLVYAFDHLLLVFDADRVSNPDRAEIVASAARDTESIHWGSNASIQRSGNGYRVQLPPAKAAGFEEGQELPCHPAPGMLAMAPLEHGRVAMDLLEHRKAQAAD